MKAAISLVVAAMAIHCAVARRHPGWPAHVRGCEQHCPEGRFQPYKTDSEGKCDQSPKHDNIVRYEDICAVNKDDGTVTPGEGGVQVCYKCKFAERELKGPVNVECGEFEPPKEESNEDKPAIDEDLTGDWDIDVDVSAEGEDEPAEGEDEPAEGEDEPAEGEDEPAEGEDEPAEGEDEPAKDDDESADDSRAKRISTANELLEKLGSLRLDATSGDILEQLAKINAIGSRLIHLLHRIKFDAELEKRTEQLRKRLGQLKRRPAPKDRRFGSWIKPSPPKFVPMCSA